MSTSSIHSQLLADCHVLGTWPEADLLLHKNASLHWFIVVPKTELNDFLDLSASEQQSILARATQVSSVLKKEFGYPKVNFAALGNVVPQMHLHVIGRRADDPCWPAPVWGNLSVNKVYSDDEIQQIRQLFF